MSPKSDIINDLEVTKHVSCDLAAKQEALTKEMQKAMVFNDDFDFFEFRAWIFMAVFYALGVFVLSCMGLTMDIVVTALVLCTLFDVTVSSRKIKYGERTLYLRKLKETGAELTARDEEHENPWRKVEDTFALHFSDLVDYAVMKYVGKDVPLIVEQEYRHATMHHSAKTEIKDEEEVKRAKDSSNLINFLRKFLLRRGDRLGTLWCGAIEAANMYGLFLNCLVNNGRMNIVKFHLFEEAEHASVTVNNLKRKTTSLERFLFFPQHVGMTMMMTLGVFGPIFENPKMLMQPKYYPMIAYETVKGVLLPIANVLAVFLHYVLPVPSIHTVYKMVWLSMRNDCEEAGIEWEIEGKAVYPLYL